jgi:hypothetical protein
MCEVYTMQTIQKDKYFSVNINIRGILEDLYFTIGDSHYNGLPDKCYIVSVKANNIPQGNLCCSIKSNHGWTRVNYTDVNYRQTKMKVDFRNKLSGNISRIPKDVSVIDLYFNLYQKTNDNIKLISQTAVAIEMVSKLQGEPCIILDFDKTTEMELSVPISSNGVSSTPKYIESKPSKVSTKCTTPEYECATQECTPPERTPMECWFALLKESRTD